jgi:dCMP deaminase
MSLEQKIALLEQHNHTLANELNDWRDKALKLSEPRVGRPTWPETWMSIARVIAERSYDPRLKVGAVIVSSDNTQMLSGGYNGNYAGGPHEHESLEPGMSGFIHAEVNALVKLDFNHPKDKHLYITHSPCRMCAKLIINAGIKRVVYEIEYRDPAGVKLLQGVGVRTLRLEDAIQSVKRGAATLELEREAREKMFGER